MPARRIQHVDLAVGDVDHSLVFYLELLGPLGAKQVARYPTYRGTEDAVHIAFGDVWLGLRPADGGKHTYYDIGLEHLGFEVDTREEVDAAYRRAVEMNAKIHFPPQEDRDIEGYWAFFVFDPDGFRVEVFCE